MKEIVVVGSLNLDLAATVERLPRASETISGSALRRSPGGKGANQAIAARRLHPRVLMVGRHGTDGSEAEPMRALRECGVDLAGVTAAPGPGGVALVLVQGAEASAHGMAAGENAIVVIPGANAALSAADVRRQRERIEAAGMVLTQLETPLAALEELVALAVPAAVPVMLDPAPAQPMSSKLLRQIAWLTPNEGEAAALLSAGAPGHGVAAACSFTRQQANRVDDPRGAAERLLALGPAQVLLKLGERGAYLATAGGLRESIAAPEVDPVDSTGAGDCLNGALAAALLQGAEPVEAVRFAVHAASLSVTRPGAAHSMPSRSEVEAFRMERTRPA